DAVRSLARSHPRRPGTGDPHLSASPARCPGRALSARRGALSLGPRRRVLEVHLRLAKAGTDGESLAELHGGVVVASEAYQHDSQMVVGACVTWIEVHGVGELPERFARASVASEGESEVAVVARGVRAQRHCLAQVGDALVELSVLGEKQAQIVVGIRI